MVRTGIREPAWWTLRGPCWPLTYHGAHRMFERVNAWLGADWTLLSRPGAQCRDCSRSVSPDRSPDPSYQSASCRVAGGVSTPALTDPYVNLSVYTALVVLVTRLAVLLQSRPSGRLPPGPHLPADLAQGLRAGERPVGVRSVRGSRAAVAGGAGSLTP